MLHQGDYEPRFGNICDELHEECRTPLPVPGEYLLLQLSPVAMAKHLGKPGLSAVLNKLKPCKYPAILVDYLEEITTWKPWHIALVLLYFGESKPESATGSGADTDASTQKLPPGEGNRSMPRRAIAGQLQFQLLAVRLRTRLCKLPRLDPVMVPWETWRGMDSLRRTDEIPPPIETRWRSMIRVPDSPLWRSLPSKDRRKDPGDYDAPEWVSGAELHRLCLLPHCEYSLDLNDEISEGRRFLDEQTQIMALLLAAIPSLPLKAKIPVAQQWLSNHDRSVDLFYEPLLSRKGDIEQLQGKNGLIYGPDRMARFHKRNTDRRGWFEKFFWTAYSLRDTIQPPRAEVTLETVEAPTSHLLLFAPPGVGEITIKDAIMRKLQVTEPSSLELLIEWLLDLKEQFMVWWAPSSVFVGPPDDEPYIPYTPWFRLVEEGIADPECPPSPRNRVKLPEFEQMMWGYWPQGRHGY